MAMAYGHIPDQVDLTTWRRKTLVDNDRVLVAGMSPG